MKHCGCTIIAINSSECMLVSTLSSAIESYVLDGHEIQYQNEFHAILSNATLYGFNRPEKVIGVSGIKMQGRFGADGNIALLWNAMKDALNENKDFGEFVSPWCFPIVGRYSKLLQAQGFDIRYIERIPRAMLISSGVEKCLEIFASSLTQNVTDQQKTLFSTSVKIN